MRPYLGLLFQRQGRRLGAVARKLNVGAVLEGSVRRSAHTVRITAQLINAVTGFHLWSKTYDRDLGDVLKLQTEIATAVAEALKVTLLGDTSGKIELGGTRNAAAFDAYLRGAKVFVSRHEIEDLPAAIGAYTEAICGWIRTMPSRWPADQSPFPMAPPWPRLPRRRAKALTRRRPMRNRLLRSHRIWPRPTSPWRQFWNWEPSTSRGPVNEYERALALAPGNAQVLRISGLFAAYMGHIDAGLAAARRAVVLDPLALDSHSLLGRALYAARRYEEAVVAFSEGISLDPGERAFYPYRGLAYYGLGDLQSARASCETKRDYAGNQWCLALTYDKLGRHADAEAEISKLKASLAMSWPTSTPRSMRSGATTRRPSNGSRRHCGCVMRAWRI